MTKFEIFEKLHRTEKPLVLANSWDVVSAKLAEKNGYKAIATSSLAVAAVLGYEDGENIPFDELLYITKRIIANTTLPVTVDIEAGYSDSIEGIINNINKLLECGAVGINLEDAKNRKLIEADRFVEILRSIRQHLNASGRNLFINARTDGYLLNIASAKEETLLRIRKYEAAGASCVFVPFVSDINHIKEMTAAVSIPLNVLSMPGLPSFHELATANVSRVSLGSSLYRAAYRNVDDRLQQILKNGNVEVLFK